MTKSASTNKKPRKQHTPEFPIGHPASCFICIFRGHLYTGRSPRVIPPSIDIRARLLTGISTGQRGIIFICVFGA